MKPGGFDGSDIQHDGVAQRLVKPSEGSHGCTIIALILDPKLPIGL